MLVQPSTKKQYISLHEVNHEIEHQVATSTCPTDDLLGPLLDWCLMPYQGLNIVLVPDLSSISLSYFCGAVFLSWAWGSRLLFKSDS